jgi:hypothetical protein
VHTTLPSFQPQQNWRRIFYEKIDTKIYLAMSQIFFCCKCLFHGFQWILFCKIYSVNFVFNLCHTSMASHLHSNQSLLFHLDIIHASMPYGSRLLSFMFMSIICSYTLKLWSIFHFFWWNAFFTWYSVSSDFSITQINILLSHTDLSLFHPLCLPIVLPFSICCLFFYHSFLSLGFFITYFPSVFEICRRPSFVKSLGVSSYLNSGNLFACFCFIFLNWSFEILLSYFCRKIGGGGIYICDVI